MTAMRIEPFLMERMQSTWENIVEYNLSESGVHPMSIKELVGEDSRMVDRLLNQELNYGQSNGTIELRQRIAAIYPEATIDHVLATNGTSEANFVTIWNLVDAEDHVVFMLPNYMQIWGIARGFARNVGAFHLREENGWHPDLEELKRIVNSKTKVIAVCNPNNPTGSILTEEEMSEIVRIAASAGAWLIADEVYQGAEREAEITATFWGRYEKVIVTNGLSKAFGLPGIRIGWVVAPPDLIARLWSYHDYTTIGPSRLSDILAEYALIPSNRARIRKRTRNILQTNYPILKDWIDRHAETFSLVTPQAGAIAYLRYSLNMNSTELVDKLLHEKSVLIVPGDHFGMDHYLRIGYGPPAEYLRTGLDRIHSTLVDVGAKHFR